MKNENTQDIENFAIELTDKANTRADWLVIVRFGLPTLLDNPGLLAEIIFRWAQKEAELDKRENILPSDFVAGIMNDLNLKFVVKEKKVELSPEPFIPTVRFGGG